MKKAIVTILMMVMLVMGVCSASADWYRESNNSYMVTKIVENWAKKCGYEDHVPGTQTCEELKFCGCFSIEEAKREFGFEKIDSQWQIFDAWRIKVFDEYGVIINIEKVGDSRGWDIFRVTGKQEGRSESILFMIYDETEV